MIEQSSHNNVDECNHIKCRNDQRKSKYPFPYWCVIFDARPNRSAHSQIAVSFQIWPNGIVRKGISEKTVGPTTIQCVTHSAVVTTYTCTPTILHNTVQHNTQHNKQTKQSNRNKDNYTVTLAQWFKWNRTEPVDDSTLIPLSTNICPSSVVESQDTRICSI